MTLDSLKIIGWILWRDMFALRKDFLNTVIDAMVVPATFIIISGYILPFMGMPDTYGSFMLVGSMLFMAYVTANFRGASRLVVDIETDKAISYELTLPVPSWMVFVKYGLTYTLNAIFINTFTLPLGKLILWNKFNLSQFHVAKFVLIYGASTLFFSFYCLWVASWVDGSRGFMRFWLRYGAQLTFFSGYQYPWATLHKALPLFSYINLLNPFVYAFEGTRAAALGQEGSLNFWICFVVLWLYITFFAYTANKNFKKRLDCL